MTRSTSPALADTAARAAGRPPAQVQRDWLGAYARGRAADTLNGALRHFAAADALEAEALEMPHSIEAARVRLGMALRMMADEEGDEPAYAPLLWGALAALTVPAS